MNNVNQNKKLVNRLFILILAITAGIGWTLMTVARNDDNSQANYLELMAQVYEIIQSSYLEDTNSEILALGAVEGILLNVSQYCEIEPLDGKCPLISEEGPFDLGLVLGYKAPMMRVLDVMPGSAAQEAGIEVGDSIFRIRTQVAPYLTVSHAHRLLTGNKDDKIDLLMQHYRSEKIEELHLSPVEYTPPLPLEIRDESGFTYLRVNGPLTPNVTSAIKDSMNKTPPASGLILDLRHLNQGEEMEGIHLADLFLKDKRLVETLCKKNGEKVKELYTGDGTELTQFPMVVIMGFGSAGPAETCAAALQAGNRAKITGARSFGKAVERKVESLNSHYNMVVVTSVYCRLNGESIHDLGVIPDVETLDPHGPKFIPPENTNPGESPIPSPSMEEKPTETPTSAPETSPEPTVVKDVEKVDMYLQTAVETMLSMQHQ